MRSFVVAFAGLILFATAAAQANVSITIDKNAQLMTVAVDGVERYQWPVSSGIPSYETPNGSFRTFRMEEDHYSKEFDDAPMPHSIFFTKIGHAIHGSFDIRHLGTPASHGCVRLDPANASKLYALVQQDGVLNTTVVLTGSASAARRTAPFGGTEELQDEVAQPSFTQRSYGSSYGGSYDDRYMPQYVPQPTFPSPDYRGRPYR